jgi:hypothetical protein
MLLTRKMGCNFKSEKYKTLLGQPSDGLTIATECGLKAKNVV